MQSLRLYWRPDPGEVRAQGDTMVDHPFIELSSFFVKFMYGHCLGMCQDQKVTYQGHTFQMLGQ